MIWKKAKNSDSLYKINPGSLGTNQKLLRCSVCLKMIQEHSYNESKKCLHEYKAN